MPKWSNEPVGSLTLGGLEGYTRANPYSVPFGGTNEMSAVEAIANLTPEQRAELLKAILPQRPIDSFQDPRFTQEMVPADPTLQDTLQSYLHGAFGSSPEGRRRAGMFEDAAHMVDPGFMLAGEARRSFGEGDTIGGLIEGGLSAAGVIPGVGPIAKGAGKAAREAMGVGRARNRVGTTGKYVGAPAGVDTPQKLGAIRKRYKDLTELGDAGRNWYEDSSNWIRDVSSDSDVARQINANALGITSQGTNVDSNLGFAIKGINQSAAGWPVRTGRFPDTASPKIESSIAGTSSEFGPKIDPFARNLSVGWNPEMALYPVHDIWDGRAFGFVGPPTKDYPLGAPWDQGFSPQQHAWMDDQADAVIAQLAKEGKAHDPLTLQAAAWTGAKIDAGELVAEDAAKHYGDFSPKYQASSTYEQIPGQGTGHLEGIVGMPFGARQDYSNLVNWMDSGGRDSLYSSAGMMTEPTIDNLGVFTPQGTGITEFNPANVARPLTQSGSLESGTAPKGMQKARGNWGLLQGADRQLLNTVEGTRAYIDAQNMGAWHRVVPQGKAGEKTGLQIELGRPVTESELKDLNDLAVENGFFAIDYGDGVRFLNDTFTELGRSRGAKMLEPRSRFGATEKRRLEADINQIVGDSNVTRQNIASDYIDFESNLAKSMEGSGAATEQLFEILDANPTIRDSIENDAMRKAQANLTRDARYAEGKPLALRGDIQNARQILAEGGWDALREAYKRGEFVPAIIGAILAPSFFGEDQEI